MHTHSTFNYVRTCRQRHGLTAQELSELVGQGSATAISKIENGDRVPTLEVALSLQVIFGLPPKAVFPEYFEWVEDRVMRRARDMYEVLQGETDSRSAAKRELLEAMAGRKEEDSATIA
jgi:transcriptional regulator with XRE-family HTH domain